MSDETDNTSAVKPPPRFPVRGPGRLYIIFGVVTTLAIVAAMFFNPFMTWPFLFSGPIWAIGNACIASGGIYLNKGETAYGHQLIRVVCVTVFVLMVGFDQIATIFVMGDVKAGDIWKANMSLISIPVYLASIAVVFFCSIVLRRERLKAD